MLMREFHNETGVNSFALWLAVVLLLLSWPLRSAGQDVSTANATVSAENAEELVWPGPPNPPRIRWLKQFASAEEVAPVVLKKPSFWKKLAGRREVLVIRKIEIPYGIATDSLGRIYVADTQAGKVWIFDVTAQQVSEFKGSGWAVLSKPVGVSIDGEDRLYVSDGILNTVFCFGPDGSPLRQFGNGQLDRPVGVAVDGKRRRLYVAEPMNHRVAIFDTETGELLSHIGGRSSKREPGKFYMASNLAVDRRGYLYVVDDFNYRVQVFNRRGAFVGAFGQRGQNPGTFARPKGIAVDSEGHIYVADSMFGNIQIFNQQGEPLMFLGSHGKGPGQFTLITGLHIDQNDRLYTTEQAIGRVQIFEYIPQPDTVENKEVVQRTDK
jgi:DNA-binding beta-propeller fold protein YncE